MKKLILITIMLLSTLTCAYALDPFSPPTKSGRYLEYVKDLKYSDGTDIEVGKSYMLSKWEDTKWYQYHRILCKITDIDTIDDSFYVLGLYCTVEERIQFYGDRSNVTYYDLNGYRTNGTLKWSRDEVGSTDIHCYDKSGMTVVKRVNNPSYCK